MTQSTCTFRTQFLTVPVVIHLPADHGTLLQWQLDGGQVQPWQPGGQDGVLVVKQTSAILWPEHTLTLTFTPKHPKETGVFFRVNAQTPKGL